MALTIGQIASAAAVNIQTIRYYEHRGLCAAPRRTPSGYRQYGDEAERFTHLLSHPRRGPIRAD